MTTTIDGGRGSDTALLGSGDDTFTWDPGDGSDTVEGQGGHDTMQFNGSNAPEHIDLSANGSRVRLFRDVANITMDLNGIENLNVAALGSADTITVNDLTRHRGQAHQHRPQRHPGQRHRRRRSRLRDRQRHRQPRQGERHQ